MADMHIDGFDAYHYAARKKQTLELYRDQIPTAPGRLGGNGLKRNHRQLQLLRKDSCVIKVLAQNTPIYSRNKPLFYRGHGGYTVYNT